MTQPDLPFRAQAFGLNWQSDIDLRYFSTLGAERAPADISIRAVEQLSERSPIQTVNRGWVFADGFRFGWSDIATFDMFDGDRIEYCPGPGWSGELPWPFYSTVTALTLAWRGMVPIHGSAVSTDGKAVLICGESGAGKSSLTAALVAQGASLISDDLSAMARGSDPQTINLIAGRPGIRLFPQIADWFFKGRAQQVAFDPRGKAIAVPAKREPAAFVALGHVVLLENQPRTLSNIDCFLALQRNLFRPKWLNALPNVARHRLMVRDLAESAHFVSLPKIGKGDEAALRDRASALCDMIHA